MKDWIMALCPEIAEWQAEMLEEAALNTMLAEREACAQLCEQYDDDGGAGETWGPRFADAIRARGSND